AESSRRGHATHLARSAASQGVDVVICLGGDGTLNETANGLIGSSTALGVLPGGSTNVFARTIGLPNDPIEATAVLLESMEARSIRRVGLGVANGRHVLFHVGVGFDAALVQQVQRRSGLQRWAGHRLIMCSGLTTRFRHYDTRRPHFTVSFPDGEQVEDGFFTIAANTNPYAFVGNRPFDIAPEANLDNGLSLITVRSLRADRLVRIMSKALRGDGSLLEDPYVHHRADVSAATIEAIDHRPFQHQIDADFFCEIERLDLGHERQAIDLLRPLDYRG